MGICPLPGTACIKNGMECLDLSLLKWNEKNLSIGMFYKEVRKLPVIPSYTHASVMIGYNLMVTLFEGLRVYLLFCWLLCHLLLFPFILIQSASIVKYFHGFHIHGLRSMYLASK